MKNTVLFIALAGLTTAASAQEFSLSLVGAPTTVDSTGGAVFTIDVIGDSSVGTHLGSGEFSLSSGSNPMIESMEWTPADWAYLSSDDGYTGNGEYNDVIFAQWIPYPGPPECSRPYPGSELGVSIGSFQITLVDGAEGELDLDLVESDSIWTLLVFEWLEGDHTWCNLDGHLGEVFNNTDQGSTLILNGASINVVPTPSSLALLGLGVLATSRRRR